MTPNTDVPENAMHTLIIRAFMVGILLLLVGVFATVVWNATTTNEKTIETTRAWVQKHVEDAQLSPEQRSVIETVVGTPQNPGVLSMSVGCQPNVRCTNDQFEANVERAYRSLGPQKGKELAQALAAAHLPYGATGKAWLTPAKKE